MNYLCSILKIKLRSINLMHSILIHILNYTRDILPHFNGMLTISKREVEERKLEYPFL